MFVSYFLFCCCFFIDTFYLFKFLLHTCEKKAFLFITFFFSKTHTATIAPFEANELGQNRLKYASYSLMFPSLFAFLVLILIIIVGFITIWRKDLQINRANTKAQLDSVAALASAQHLNAFNALSTYATPATTLHHHQSTGSSNQQCVGHFDELRGEHSCISSNTEEHLLTDACFQLNNNTPNTTNLSANNCSVGLNNCNHYTFAPVYGQSNLNHHDTPNLTVDQFKELNQQTLQNTINTAINKSDCQECHTDCHLMPTPYASNQLDYDRVIKQTTSISNQLANVNLANTQSICPQHTYTVTPITTGTLNQQAANQLPAPTFTFDRYNNCPNASVGNSEHTYDIPIPTHTPKWV